MKTSLFLSIMSLFFSCLSWVIIGVSYWIERQDKIFLKQLRTFKETETEQ